MEKNPQISVVIPVYNSESYLRNCLNSILQQKNQDFEVIMVNDGSKDKSGEICDEYSKKDKRFKVIHKTNEGVSIARNIALNQAKGEWISFIDSDDDITEDFLTIPIECHTASVIQKNYFRICLDGTKTLTHLENKCLSTPKEIAYFWLNKRTNSLWNKLIRRDIIGNYRFIPNIDISEDFLFFTSIIHRVKKYAFSNIGAYRYYERPNSAMKNFENNLRKNIHITFEHLHIIRSYENENKDKWLYEGLVYGYFMNALWNLRRALTKEERKEFNSLLNEMKIKSLFYVNKKTKFKLLFIKMINLTSQHG